MILGIGNDLVDVARIEKMVTRFGQRALARIYTPSEIAYVMNLQSAALRFGALAKRFAAKEAGSKALGTGIAQGIGWQHLEVVRDLHARPFLIFHGAALQHLQSLTPQGFSARTHLSLSDDSAYAQAFVVIEALAIETAVKSS
jgi:holo-[acyl-carrier protein] synthase